MWSRSTVSPSLVQTSCCFTRAWSASWSMLKEIAAFDSLAEKRFTGIETSPKEIVAVPVGRSAMGHYSTPPGATGSQPGRSGGSGRDDDDRNRARREDFLRRASEEAGEPAAARTAHDDEVEALRGPNDLAARPARGEARLRGTRADRERGEPLGVVALDRGDERPRRPLEEVFSPFGDGGADVGDRPDVEERERRAHPVREPRGLAQRLQGRGRKVHGNEDG